MMRGGLEPPLLTFFRSKLRLKMVQSTYLKDFLQTIKYTPAGNPSKKDVNRFLVYCILLSGEYDGHLFTINLKPYNEVSYILWEELKASHYYTFEKISTRTYSFMPTKPTRANLICKDNSLCIKKHTIVYITKHLLADLFDKLNITSLRKIDRIFKRKGFSDTSCKVLKQVSFEFIPLHPVYTKDISKLRNGIQLKLNKWISSRSYCISKMISRKFRHMKPLVTYELDSDILTIKSDKMNLDMLLKVLS